MDIDLRRAYRRAHRNPKIDPRPCVSCHQTFQPKRVTSETCCRSCYNRAYAGGLIQNGPCVVKLDQPLCQICQTPFVSSLYFRTVCSEACRKEARRVRNRRYRARCRVRAQRILEEIRGRR